MLAKCAQSWCYMTERLSRRQRLLAEDHPHTKSSYKALLQPNAEAGQEGNAVRLAVPTARQDIQNTEMEDHGAAP
jgi:hypothetical protein